MLNDVIKQVAVKLDPDQAQESQQQHQIVVRPQVKIKLLSILVFWFYPEVI